MVVACLGWFIYSISGVAAKSVVTVDELRAASMLRERIRLGARVVGKPQRLSSSDDRPKGLVRFRVLDIERYAQQKEAAALEDANTITVEYEGAMPDTLVAGRDVILEGDYEAGVFRADSLMTQCPSKYEAPMPKNATTSPELS